MASIPHSGNIRTYPLSDILEHLRHTKATGTLTLSKSGTEKSIYFKTGHIVFAASTDSQDRLGEILVRLSRLTREKLEQALTIHQKNAGLKKLGAILVEKGFVTPKDLFSGLKAQVKDIIFSLFLWEEGAYQFEEHLPPDMIQLQINIQELIAEIIQRIKDQS